MLAGLDGSVRGRHGLARVLPQQPQCSSCVQGLPLGEHADLHQPPQCAVRDGRRRGRTVEGRMGRLRRIRTRSEYLLKDDCVMNVVAN
eukprot:349632-Chlamydomonas_euryale.AAC.36